VVAAIGPGTISLDNWVGIDWSGLEWAVGAVVVGAIGGLVSYALGRFIGRGRRQQEPLARAA
jgi:hypothetical protein